MTTGANLLGLIKTPGTPNTDVVGSITPTVTSIAALRAMTTPAFGAPGLDNPVMIYCAGWATPFDGGQGWLYCTGVGAPGQDNGGTIFQDASLRVYKRIWDGINFLAAWAGMLPSTADIGPLFQNLPQLAVVEFIPNSTYTVATYPTQYGFSNKFYRGNGVIWKCTGSLLPDFDATKIAFNWVYVPYLYGTYGGSGALGGGNADMTNAGVSPIEGIGIVSMGDGSSGVGIAFGMPIPFNDGGTRSTTSHSTGKFHFEVTVNSIAPGPSGFSLGISSSAYPINFNMGYSPLALAFNFLGDVYIDLAHLAHVDPVNPGDTCAFEIDFDAQLIWICNTTTNPTQWNASGTANPATGVGGISFAALAPATQYFATADMAVPDIVNLVSSTASGVTGNFGASAFAKAASAGFSAWGSGTTFNPADQANLTFSNGNLTVVNNTPYFIAAGPFGPEQYFIRPQNFGIGGFFINVGFLSPSSAFLTGIENVLIKGGNIGFVFNYNNDSNNSGENIRIANSDIVGLASDAIQLFNIPGKTTIDGTSIDYCHRAILSQSCSTFFKNVYCETNQTSTPGELISVDGAGMMTLDGTTTLLNTGTGQVGDYVNFNGNGNPTVVRFQDTPVYDINPNRVFLCSAAFSNAYGTTVGWNANNFAFVPSSNQNMQANGTFATGDLSFFPGATATYATPSQFGGQGAASFTGSQTLPSQTYAVNPGEIIYALFFDFFNGSGTIAGNAVFKTADGTTVATTALGPASSIPNFQPADLAHNWGVSVHQNAMERFVFLVPQGASTMQITISTTGLTGIYILTGFFVHR